MTAQYEKELVASNHGDGVHCIFTGLFSESQV